MTTLPRLHANGTRPENLARDYDAVVDALEAALGLLRETAPNARDYDGPADFDAAAAEHRARDGRLRDVKGELEVLVAHCLGG